MAARPDRQVCPICGLDDDVQLLQAAGEWIFTCDAATHVPYEWRPTLTSRTLRSYRSGVGEELGVYDDLLACVDDGLAEYGVIEYRFATRAPETYAELIRRYSHGALGPKRYTTSSFLGGALGQLWREEAIDGRWVPATAYWSYNTQVGGYATAPVHDDTPVLSWEQFATSLGIDPQTWPPVTSGTG